MGHHNNAKWLLAGLLLAACSQDNSVTDNGGKQSANGKGVTASVKAFEADDATRTTLTLDEQYGLTFKWSESDKVAVFGKTDMEQATMSVTVGDDPSEATFTCNSFQLLAGNDYCAYLPFSSDAEVNDEKTETKIPVNYTGQTHTGNATTAHLGDYDYLVSDVCTPTSLNTCHFTLKHMGAALRLQLTMPTAGNWQKVTLSAEDGNETFTTLAYLDLFSDTYGNSALETKETAQNVTLNLSDGTNDYISTTADDNVLTTWLMLAPVDLANKTVAVSVLSSDGKECIGSFTPTKAYAAGKAYSVNLTMAENIVVDLGLSVKWAAYNVGASCPEESGGYFAWGETTTKSSYDTSNSTTYCVEKSTLQSKGIIDSDGNLTASYDAATANWGSKWRMPKKSEIQELCDKCTWTWTTINGVNGYKVTGSNGNSIFLPVGGYREGTSLKNGSYGYYWSSTPDESYSSMAYRLYFLNINTNNHSCQKSSRNYGQPVRPVTE